MTQPPGSRSRRPDPLPPGFGEDLLGLDARLGHALRDANRDAPLGLADRIFAASRRELPASAPIPAAIPFPATGWRRQLGRLALAASVGLAVVAAGWLGRGGPEAAPSRMPSVFEVALASSSPTAEYEDELRPLLDASALGRDDLAGELGALIASLDL